MKLDLHEHHPHHHGHVPHHRPMLASAAMSLSSVSVIANALRLRRLAL